MGAGAPGRSTPEVGWGPPLCWRPMTSPVDPPEASAAAHLRPPPPQLPPPTDGITGGDWPEQAADALVGAVDKVRSKTTGPLLSASRGVVYGLMVAVLAVVVGILFVIFGIRLLDELLPSGVWLPYLILGTLFMVAGALVFQRRR